jgi:hypothetical protein
VSYQLTGPNALEAILVDDLEPSVAELAHCSPPARGSPRRRRRGRARVRRLCCACTHASSSFFAAYPAHEGSRSAAVKAADAELAGRKDELAHAESALARAHARMSPTSRARCRRASAADESSASAPGQVTQLAKRPGGCVRSFPSKHAGKPVRGANEL